MTRTLSIITRPFLTLAQATGKNSEPMRKLSGRDNKFQQFDHRNLWDRNLFL